MESLSLLWKKHLMAIIRGSDPEALRERARHLRRALPYGEALP